MLTLGDAGALREEVLPIEEANLRYQERVIAPMHSQYQLYDHDELKDERRRRGCTMHSSTFVAMVKQLNPNIRVHQQVFYTDQWGFYFEVKGVLTYISGFRKGWLQEFTSIKVDERDLMDGDEIRGWRHVLLKLMSVGALGWDQVLAAFGDTVDGNSRRWRQNTAIFRQRGSTQKVMANLG